MKFKLMTSGEVSDFLFALVKNMLKLVQFVLLKLHSDYSGDHVLPLKMYLGFQLTENKLFFKKIRLAFSCLTLLILWLKVVFFLIFKLLI